MQPDKRMKSVRPSLPDRSAKLARTLGASSLVMLGLSIVALTLAFKLQSMAWAAIVIGIVLMVIALTVAAASMIVRRKCLNPRPVAPVVALGATCVWTACVFLTLVSLAPGPHGF